MVGKIFRQIPPLTARLVQVKNGYLPLRGDRLDVADQSYKDRLFLKSAPGFPILDSSNRWGTSYKEFLLAKPYSTSNRISEIKIIAGFWLILSKYYKNINVLVFVQLLSGIYLKG